ncbi:hypothetical protein Javan422_0042 [Streptococcus phage Javan422]|nr:hypothetical protein Javan422_0042 [Streptococcus phage Javan422]
MEYLVVIVVGVLVLEFMIKRGLELYLYIKEQLDETTKY